MRPSHVSRGSSRHRDAAEFLPGAARPLFVAEQGRLYLAVPHRGAQRSEIRMYEVRD